MMDETMRMIAERYGIEIEQMKHGDGGLFYGKNFDCEVTLEDLFADLDIVLPRQESICMDKCSLYSVYSAIVTSMLIAA